MIKQAIMTSFKECLRCVNRTPGELERAIKVFTDTVDTIVDADLPPEVSPPPLPPRVDQDDETES